MKSESVSTPNNCIFIFFPLLLNRRLQSQATLSAQRVQRSTPLVLAAAAPSAPAKEAVSTMRFIRGSPNKVRFLSFLGVLREVALQTLLA